MNWGPVNMTLSRNEDTAFFCYMVLYLNLDTQYPAKTGHDHWALDALWWIVLEQGNFLIKRPSLKQGSFQKMGKYNKRTSLS